MKLIIDGYNFLRALPEFKLLSSVDQQKRRFLSLLQPYYSCKKKVLQEVCVVYDGGLFSHAERVVKKGVIIINAGYKRTADEYICEKSEIYGAGGVVVTNDRELARQCEVYNAQVISVSLFRDCLQSAVEKVLRESSFFARSFDAEVTMYEREEDEVSEEVQREADMLLLMAIPGGIEMRKNEEEYLKRDETSISFGSKKDRLEYALYKLLK